MKLCPPQRKSSRSVKRRNFADLEEPPVEDDDSWEVGDDSDGDGTGVAGGGRKRRRPSAAAGGGPAEDRRFGELTSVCCMACTHAVHCSLWTA